jgi:hypothetical protein
MDVKVLAWLGVQTSRFDELVGFLRDVMGLPLAVKEPGFAEFGLPDGPDPGLRSEHSRPEGAASLPVFLPSRGEVLHTISTAEHLTEPKLPRTRDMSYSRAFLVEPPEQTVRGKVPASLYHKRLTCDVFSTFLDVHVTHAHRRTRRRHPHSPPA